VGLSSGRSLAKIRACVTKYVEAIPGWVKLIPATLPYDATPDFDCPFPSHPNYDLKAWQLLCKNLRRFREPILFWNIGS